MHGSVAILQQSGGPSRRRGALALLAVVILLLFGAVASQVAFNLTFLHPDTTQQTFFFAGTSALVFFLFVVLTFVLARNLLKLSAERRIGVLGSAFRARMVLGALVISFLPVIFMFNFSYGLMNRSIERWFSRPVEELREDAAHVSQLLSDYAAQNAQAESDSLARDPQLQRAIQTHDIATVRSILSQRDISLQGGFALLLEDDKLLAAYHAPPNVADLLSDDHARTVKGSGGTFLLGKSAVDDGHTIVVAMPLPPAMGKALAHIDESERQYRELAASRKLVRRGYMQMLLLLTVVVLFAATWLSLFVARLVTRPVAALAEATQEIAKGNLQYRVQITAADELGELITSFNRMAGDLEASQKQIETSRTDLSDANVALSQANAALEQQRKEIEAILQSVPAGVLSLDAQGRVQHSNNALPALLGRGVAPGTPIRDVFPADLTRVVEHLLRQADRMGSAARATEMETPAGAVQIELTVASLRRQRQHAGYVLVVEDLSDLVRAQRQAAWREVARRVAHEIKNPLTPIALSADRIRRHLDRSPNPDAASVAVIHGCTETISGAVETVRKLVDEFSTLARFPAANPHPSQLNPIIESALAMFEGRLDGIRLRTNLSPDLPLTMADPEGIRRVVANLVDNAAEAVHGALLREISVSTAAMSDRETVEIVIADTGQGVSRADKERLFMPYFSTKDRGTGLGLAIVSRIVEEHGGSVRVEENEPVGTRFVVELPVATQEMSETHA